MRKLSTLAIVLLSAALSLTAGPVAAQTEPGSATPAAGSTAVTERSFLSFIEEAAIAQRQWWEGQFEFSDSDLVEATIVRGVVAVQPWQDVEIGARAGFGNTTASSGLPDGSGGTDFDVWGKYMLGRDQRGADYAVGGAVSIPTGDESAGLGVDAFGASLFGAARYPLPRLTLGGNIGLRFNGDAQPFGGPEQDGQTSAKLGGMVVAPLNESLNLVGELGYESERFDGADDDVRALGGVNWRVFRRGTVRGAIGVGLSDGAPDLQLLVGYAAEF